MSEAYIRKAKPGEEAAIHDAHMRSIREVAVKDHGLEEIKGWGYRELGDRWIQILQEQEVLVVEAEGKIEGYGYIKIYEDDGNMKAHLYGLYLTPKVVNKGFGLQLANLMIERARKAGVKEISLGSSKTGYRFYKKLGFMDVGQWKKVDIGGYPVTSIDMVFTICELE